MPTKAQLRKQFGLSVLESTNVMNASMRYLSSITQNILGVNARLAKDIEREVLFEWPPSQSCGWRSFILCVSLIDDSLQI
jgi:hypothetical protein